MAATPDELLEAGRIILDPVLTKHGFRWAPERTGHGSGGNFAIGAYIRDTRRLELHFRFSLGLVSYSFGDQRVSHVDYMRVAVGPNGRRAYPGFSQDPLAGFRHLAKDLAEYATAFLSGTDQELAAMIETATEAARVGAKKRLP